MNRRNLATVFILAAWAVIFVGVAHANGPAAPPPPAPVPTATATSASSTSAAADAVAAQGQSQSAGSDAAVSVDNSPSVGFLLGGNGSGSDSTAPCLERRPSWGFGFRGDKTKLNATCWAEYSRAAEHGREMDAARLELERLRLEIERERVAIERVRAEQCFECSQQK